MMLKLFAATVLLVAATMLPVCADAEFAPTGGGPPGPSQKARFEYARGIYMQGSYDAAVEELRKFVRDFPKGEYADDAYYWLGKYQMMTGSYDDALDQFARITSQMPTGDMAPAAQVETAGYYAEPLNPGHDFEKALVEYMKLPFYYPESPLLDDAAYHAGLCQMKLGRYAQAEDTLRSFSGKYQGSGYVSPALYQLGMACIMQGRTDDALSAFQSVRDNHPAGLYRQKALDAIELVIKTRDRRGLKPSTVYGSKGSAPGMFNKPSGAAIDEDGRLYVADLGNSRVQRFSVTASGLTLDNPDFGPPASDKGSRMSQPAGVAAGPNGRIYITDASLNRVQVLGPDGSVVLAFGRRGKEAGEMDNPGAIAVDEGGNIYVADRGNRRVSKFDPKGRFVSAVGVFGSRDDDRIGLPAGIALDMEGNLLVTDDKYDRLYRFDPSGKLMTVVGGKDERGKNRLDNPTGIGVDGIGNVYVADEGSKSVVVFDRGLNPAVVSVGGGDKDVLDMPAGMAVSGAGVVYVTDYGQGRVVVLR